MLNYIALSLLMAANPSDDGAAEETQPVSHSPAAPIAPPPLGFKPPSNRATEQSSPKASERIVAVPINNSLEWVNPDDYPAKALREELEGTVIFNLSVDKYGLPSNCAIIKSSGHEILDTRTCETLMLRARFEPIKSKDNKFPKREYRSRVTWKVPESSPLPLAEDFATTTNFKINDAAEIIDCSVETIGLVPDEFSETNCDGLNEIPPTIENLISKSIREGSRDYSFRVFFYQPDNISIQTMVERSAKSSIIIFKAALEISPLGLIKNCEELPNNLSLEICSDYSKDTREFQPFESSEGNRNFIMLSEIIVPADDKEDQLAIRPYPVPTRDIDTLIVDIDFPSHAILKGIEGVTSYRLTIDTEGRVRNCVITKSSGSSNLDAETCKLMKRRARFYPATDREGKPIIGTYSGKEIWKLPPKT